MGVRRGGDMGDDKGDAPPPFQINDIHNHT